MADLISICVSSNPISDMEFLSTPAPFHKAPDADAAYDFTPATPDTALLGFSDSESSLTTSDSEEEPLSPVPAARELVVSSPKVAPDFTPYPKQGKQFTLYNHDSGMNMWKICFILEELGLTYNDVYMDFAGREHKSEAYLELNPNGKIPTLVDHSNDDFVVWESNPIIKYLSERYDPKGILSITDQKDQYRLDQWLFFQASGQGPYFGQAQWFMKFHKEYVPSAIERYQREIKRVFTVLERSLRDRDWLVGDKCTIADISFFKYNDYASKELLPQPFDFAGEFPNVYDWHQRVLARPSVQYVLKYKEELRRNRPTQKFEWNVEGERV